MDLNFLQWILAASCSMMIGMTKAGVAGIGLVAVVILADLFGGKSSSGIILPMLCIADTLAVLYYRQHAQMKLILKLMPWVLLGLVAGVFIGNFISDKVFKITIGVIVLICLLCMK